MLRELYKLGELNIRSRYIDNERKKHQLIDLFWECTLTCNARCKHCGSNAEKKKYTHVGLYVGNGLVIEAAGARQGVISGKVTASKWTHWGELKGVNYSGVQPDPEQPSEPADDKDVVTFLPTLRKGSKGEYVKKLQKSLQKLGYDLGSYGVDGDFGRATEAAVKAFQMDRGLKVDGVCGPATWSTLDNPSPAPVVTLYTVHIPYLTDDKANNLISQYPGSWKTTE